jgi:hypothetical protein
MTPARQPHSTDWKPTNGRPAFEYHCCEADDSGLGGMSCAAQVLMLLAPPRFSTSCLATAWRRTLSAVFGPRTTLSTVE